MKTRMLLRAVLAGALLLAAGCVQSSYPVRSGSQLADNPAERGYDIDMNSVVVLRAHLEYMPSLSGYDLPEGEYRPVKQDADGIYFKAVNPVRSISLGGGMLREGGIYLPKRGSSAAPFVFVDLPLMGWAPYYMPRDFFDKYGTQWIIVPAKRD
jgi:hypothetical protein